MTSASVFRPTPELSLVPHIGGLGFPLAAAKAVIGGTLVAIDSSANLVDATDATAVDVVGVANGDVDNTAGSAGAKRVEVLGGCYWFKNQDSIAATDVGAYAFVYDNCTVQKAPSTTGLVCGQIVAVDSVLGVAVWLYTPWTRPQIFFKGTTTLVSGTKDIQVPQLKSTSRIFLTMKDPGAGALTEMAALDAPAGSRNTTTAVFTINCIDDTSSAVITTAVPTVDYMVAL